MSDLLRVPLRRTDRRLSLLVLLVCAGIYLPTLGRYGMFDPWETHYTEVARQLLERGDWLSPHWHNGTGPDGRAESNFWSKPIGSMWLSGLSLWLSGWAGRITLRAAPSGADPGEVLATKEVEWAVRLPFFLCGLFGIFCVYLMCARLFSHRAGLLSAAILATSPIYFFVSRQAMTDTPYVGLMSGGIALFALGVFGEHEPLPRRSLKLGGRTLDWPHHPGYYLFCALFALVVVLQLAAIVPPLLRVPLGVTLGRRAPSAALWMAAYGALALVALCWSRKARSRNEIYLYGFYMATGLAGVAKGLAGALQPGLFVLLYLLASREWRLLREVALGRGLTIAACLFAPWYHGMLLRHGRSFYNELFGTHHFRRLTIGEQAQAKGTWEYYLKQLGYALFPWVALLPAALGNRGARGDPRARARLFCIVWLAGALLLFTLSRTKYHYYFLPAIPPAAILVALYLDDVLAGRQRALGLAVLVAIVTLGVVAIDLVRQPAHWVWLYTYLYGGVWERGVPGGWPLWLYAALFGAALLALPWRRLRRGAVWALVAVAILVGGPVLNWHQLGCARHWSQKEVLQSYYRLRRGPEEPLVAWNFNWRGETWYTAAQVVVSINHDDQIRDWLAHRAGRRVFFVTESGRFGGLQRVLPTPRGRRTLHVVDGSNVHFVLAAAQL